VRRAGSSVLLWGLVRRATEATRVEVLVRDPGRASSSVAATRPTDAAGVWTARLPWRSGRTWRIRWTTAEGATYVGPPTRAYG
jgi:polysaccharide biosynthesis protein PslG